MTQPHIGIQIERISRITKYLPREDIDQLLLKFVVNFI
jgi:hypothetical protein